MNQLLPDLVKTDFDQLVALGRALLPRLAPSWTDHNLHDPGIMLIELLAWTADAQIYSLARMRHDEREAYAALLGLVPRGPAGATGLVWPNPPGAAPWGAGAILSAHAAVTAGQPLPVFRLTHSIECTAARLVSVTTQLHDGTTAERTLINGRSGAGFLPFGVRASTGDRLILDFSGALHAPDAGATSDACLAFGVRVPAGVGRSAGAGPVADGPPAAAARQRFDAWLVDSVVRYPLTVVDDSTDGFQRTGAILLDTGAVPETLGTSYTIIFECRDGGFPGAPRISAILPNVLPIEQIEDKTLSFPSGLSGAPDLTLPLNAPGLMFSTQAPAPTVTFTTPQGDEPWSLADDLSECGPNDKVFAFDATNSSLRFGNGINGRLPPPWLPLTIHYSVSSGATGNAPPGLTWSVPDIAGIYGKNLDPTAGGVDAVGSSELQRLARQRCREAHAVVTSADAIDAALGVANLDVVRAEALGPGANPTPPADLQVVRTLVVLRDRHGAAESAGVVPESPAWLGEIQRQLLPRILLGERLRVIAPVYTPLAVVAMIEARRDYDPAPLASAATALLAARFRIVTNASGAPVWPLSRAVDTRDIQARLRALPGVARVRSCALYGANRSPWAQPSPLPAHWLPQLLIDQCEIVVVRSTTEYPS
ncbi:putative phage baseplate assembly protein [Paraburkholderia sp. RAU2J]|uniref:hypothetical protein n=1 Tax=Paraburkholderia sp. RAU2J TaxID=1938810 RepID=UPI000EB41086|nr:hypothetical protein [Paraburkholderia sp. RAU2J]RKT13290.1 putative phage baseplate assembly protein [Paraburkholderia sp. RAU2J]